MKYYLLGWEDGGNPVPRIRNWMDRLDLHAMQKKEIAKLPPRILLYLEENPDTLFSDIISSPFFLVSEMVWDVMRKYGVRAEKREIILLDTENGLTALYYLPLLEECDCLSEKSVFNNSRDTLHEIILDQKKAAGLPPIFGIAGMEKDYVIGRMDFVESILRRGAEGIRVTELKTDEEV